MNGKLDVCITLNGRFKNHTDIYDNSEMIDSSIAS